MIVSPLNYPGNKFRILDQIFPHFPSNIDHFVDMFCGGGSVGINVNAKKVTFVDNDPKVIGLLKFLFNSDFDKLIDKSEKIIKEYNLTNSYKNTYKFYKSQIKDNPNNGLKKLNEEGYYKLRTDYNNIKNKHTDKAFSMLYILMLYSFNNGLRFNKSGEFNLPAGKTDFNNKNVKKIKTFLDRKSEKEYRFILGSYNDKEVWEEIKNSDFIYMDPPYLLSTAVYNETSGWDKESEKELMKFLNKLKLENIDFALSNILQRGNSVNEELLNWQNSSIDYKFINIEYHYRSASYNKINRNVRDKEILLIKENR